MDDEETEGGLRIGSMGRLGTGIGGKTFQMHPAMVSKDNDNNFMKAK